MWPACFTRWTQCIWISFLVQMIVIRIQLNRFTRSLCSLCLVFLCSETQGSYIQIGDIVSLCNSNYDTFYAQIRGLMIDSFCEKSAVLTWLLPTDMSPPPNEQFDPSTYIIGPDEDHPRLLSCMEFIMHAPSDYYHNKNTPYPPVDFNEIESTRDDHTGFIWTNIEI